MHPAGGLFVVGRDDFSGRFFFGKRGAVAIQRHPDIPLALLRQEFAQDKGRCIAIRAGSENDERQLMIFDFGVDARFCRLNQRQQRQAMGFAFLPLQSIRNARNILCKIPVQAFQRPCPRLLHCALNTNRRLRLRRGFGGQVLGTSRERRAD